MAEFYFVLGKAAGILYNKYIDSRKAALPREGMRDMADREVCDEIVRLLRSQRHDFINHLQVIHAMLQLGRTERAITYIDDLAKDSRLVTDTLRLHGKYAENCQLQKPGQ
jgi:hypothetical protein